MDRKGNPSDMYFYTNAEASIILMAWIKLCQVLFLLLDIVSRSVELHLFHN